MELASSSLLGYIAIPQRFLEVSYSKCWLQEYVRHTHRENDVAQPFKDEHRSAQVV